MQVCVHLTDIICVDLCSYEQFCIYWCMFTLKLFLNELCEEVSVENSFFIKQTNNFMHV